MIPERWHDQVTLYVLDELAADERAAFETELGRNPALRIEVRHCADTFAAVAAESAIAAPLPRRVWVSLHHRVAATTPLRTAADRASAVVPMPVWRRFVWPAAAALFLALNLWQWVAWGPGPERPEKHRTPAREERQTADAESARSGGASGSVLTAVDTGNASASRPPGEIDGENRRRPPETVEYWRDRYKTLVADYAAFVETVAPIVTAALVRAREEAEQPPLPEERVQSEQAFAGALWERADALLANLGLAVLPDRWRLPGGYTFNPDAVPSVSTSGSPMFAREATGDGAPAPPPYGFGLLNHAEGLGYLDLYNLPLLSNQQQLQLWLRADDGTSYVRVGEVPSNLGGGSGAVVFRIPPTAASSGEFLVTIEPPQLPPQPTGPIVIAGP